MGQERHEGGQLARAFLAAAGDDTTEPTQELETALAVALARSSAGQARVRTDARSFMAHLGRHVTRSEEGWVPALGAARVEELFICWSCAEQDPAALSAFDERYGPVAESAVRKVDPSPGFVADVMQLLREKLFLGKEGGRPKIGDFAGRGPLDAWVRAAAARTALNAKDNAGVRREESLEGDGWANLQGASGDPDLTILRTRFREHFAEAFQAAFQSLEPQSRALLRLHLLDGVSIDRLGVMYQTHRSTAARWVAKARETLVRRTRTVLSDRLGVPQTEVDEIMALARSQLDVSIRRFLQNTQG